MSLWKWAHLKTDWGQTIFLEPPVTYLSGGGMHRAGGRTRCTRWPPLGLGLALILKHIQTILTSQEYNVRGFSKLRAHLIAESQQSVLKTLAANDDA
jgi:hypothetical protein